MTPLLRWSDTCQLFRWHGAHGPGILFSTPEITSLLGSAGGCGPEGGPAERGLLAPRGSTQHVPGDPNGQRFLPELRPRALGTGTGRRVVRNVWQTHPALCPENR